MSSTRRERPVALPRRKGRQTLQGFVREHLTEIERALFEGVPYRSLLEALREAGFREGTSKSLRVAVCVARKGAVERTSTQVAQPPTRGTAEASQRAQPSSRPLQEDDLAALRKRFRELVRPPRPGSDEPDLLV